MPLPPAPREIDRLTEGWPVERDNSELSAFAAAFRSDRPELSAPALDRINRQLLGELARSERFAARKRTAVARIRRFAPLAAAAAVLLAVGAWLHLHPAALPPNDLSRTKENPSSLHGVPVLQPRPDGPGEPASKPTVN